MASRVQQKEAARKRRLAEEQARQERERRQRRMMTLGGTLIAAIAVVAVLVAISSGGGGGSAGIPKSHKAQASTVNAVSTLLNGIPQSGATLGSPSAPVTMTYYGDLECPACQAFTLQGGFPQLVANDVRAGKVKVVYSGHETATRDPAVFKTQQVAALAAGMQNRFWYFTELFYHQQGAEGSGYVTENYLDTLAQQVPGLNYSTWRRDRSQPSIAKQVLSDQRQSDTIGITSTPTLIFTGPKGKAQPSSTTSYSDLQSALKQVS